MKGEAGSARQHYGTISGIVIAALLVVVLAGCDQQDALHEAPAPSAPQPILFTGTVAASGLTSSEDYIGTQGVTPELLARGAFLDDIDGMFRLRLAGTPGTTVTNIKDAKDVLFLKLTFQPGGFVGWHTHPAPAVVAVAQGKLTIVNASDCKVRPYEAGESFLDPGRGNVHVAVNETQDDVVVYATFIDVPPGVGPTELLSSPGDCSL